MEYFCVLQLEFFIEGEDRPIAEFILARGIIGFRFDLIFFEGVVGGDD